MYIYMYIHMCMIKVLGDWLCEVSLVKDHIYFREVSLVKDHIYFHERHKNDREMKQNMQKLHKTAI